MSIKIDMTGWSGAIPIIQDFVEKAATIRLQKAQLDAYTALRQATPVDTGAARGGWQIDKDGNKFVVINDVHYIVQLNEGHSKQQPNAGWIERIIARHL